MVFITEAVCVYCAVRPVFICSIIKSPPSGRDSALQHSKFQHLVFKKYVKKLSVDRSHVAFHSLFVGHHFNIYSYIFISILIPEGRAVEFWELSKKWSPPPRMCFSLLPCCSFSYFSLFVFKGRSVAEAVSCRPLTVGSLFRSQVRPYEICGK
jgi:hypothetical protein